MRLDRAAKFGVFGSIGFVVIWLGTFAMIRETQTGVTGGTVEGDVITMIVLVGGTVVGMMFLFTLIGEYIDRELDSRGIANIEE
jgi:hypothetical protein